MKIHGNMITRLNNLFYSTEVLIIPLISMKQK